MTQVGPGTGSCVRSWLGCGRRIPCDLREQRSCDELRDRQRTRLGPFHHPTPAVPGCEVSSSCPHRELERKSFTSRTVQVGCIHTRDSQRPAGADRAANNSPNNSPHSDTARSPRPTTLPLWQTTLLDPDIDDRAPRDIVPPWQNVGLSARNEILHLPPAAARSNRVIPRREVLSVWPAVKFSTDVSVSLFSHRSQQSCMGPTKHGGTSPGRSPAACVGQPQNRWRAR